MVMFKLRINVARFALENSEIEAEKEGPVKTTRPPGQNFRGGNPSVRDVRSYKEVVGGSNSGSGSAVNFVGNPVAGPSFSEKFIIVPDRVEAFKECQGLAVVGRAVDLETLVDIDRLLSIAKIVVANVQYLGGLSVLITFHEEESAKQFLSGKNIWEPWFSKLDPWKGQTLPFERVAWLKLTGIPLHLFEDDVLSRVGEAFGKVLHVPKGFEEDQDLSIVRVGVLVGHHKRILDEAVLSWKCRSFRVGIEEDYEVWVPDCLRRLSESEPDRNQSSDFSPVNDDQPSGVGVSQMSGGTGGAEESPVENGLYSQGFGSKLHGEDDFIMGGGSSQGNVESMQEEREGVGPEENNGVGGHSFQPAERHGINFLVGSGNVGCSKRHRRSRLGPRSKLGQSSSSNVLEVSPGSLRPNKRVRSEPDDFPPGFGYVGFTSRVGEGAAFSQTEKDGSNGNLDLNVSALAEDPPAEERVGDPVIEGGDAEQGGIDPVARSSFEKEMEKTIQVGAQIGIDLTDHTDLLRKVIFSPGWIKSIRKEFNISFVAIQESKQGNISHSALSRYWGRGVFGFETVDSSGLSGGLIWMWDESVFAVEGFNKHRNFLHIRGKLKGSNRVVNLLNVYAPQGIQAKKEIWDLVGELILSHDGLWAVCGDFNAVRFREEKRNCSYKPRCASNFNSFIYDSGLMEYEMKGRNFTWQSENNQKLSKLDRFLVNSDFFNEWPEACVQALPNLWSDHCPIVLSSKSVNYGARPFRFFNSWLGKEGFKEVVEEACLSFSVPECNPDVKLIKKLGYVRSKIKEWRDVMRSKEEESLNMAKQELEELESILQIRDLEEDESWALAENKRIIEEIDLAKVKNLKQRSRVRWAKEGDENSKFFHSMINCRKASNVIHGLSIGNEWVAKRSLVKKEVFNFFRLKYMEDSISRPRLQCPNLKKISEDEARGIESSFSTEEIKAAVFECGDDRAPGPDGFNFRFFKTFWRLFEEDFASILSDFFDSGRISEGCGSSFITLVPKVRDPMGLGDYRPISLVGVINKVVSKILANRLKKVLGSVISDSQSAFLGGRLILDGPLVINEVHAWLKRSGKKAFLFKIDFEKAYDNISWKFVVDMFSNMGFGERWCKWIWGVLSSARASVLVNGAPTFEFKWEKGMRQGDPLSPFLFVAVMEGLSNILDRAKEVGVFSGVALPEDGPSISHLFFADDALIVGEWDSEGALNVVRLLRSFHACSGLKINLGKSNLYGIGVDNGEVGVVADAVGCKQDSLPFKYLGLKVGANMNRVNNWKTVYDIFESRLALWKSALLSMGGRTTLIRSVLQSLPCYYFSLYRAPVKVIKDLEGMIRKFLWGGSSAGNKTHWVSWDLVASPKDKGGLGLNKLSNINKAMLFKWAWRYKTEKGRLWVKVVDSFHSKGSGWSFLPVKKSAGGVWSNIVAVVNKPLQDGSTVRNFFKSNIGRGDNTLFWLDPWLRNIPLKDCFPHLFALEVVKTCSVEERLSGNWLWRHDPDQEEEAAELAELCAAVADVVLSEREDGWGWKGDQSGVFSVISAKKLLEKLEGSVTEFKLEWCKWVPIKCNLFVWRAGLGRIPTGDELQKRGIDVGEGICPLCKSEVETAAHLFTSCYIAAVLWQKISSWCRIPPIYPFSVKDLLEFHKYCSLSSEAKVALHGIIFSACWCLWLMRNKAIFSAAVVKVDCIFSEVKSLGFLWYNNRSKGRSISWDDWCRFVFM
ncbi:putative RNA-directed DNA polymerase [Helianthus annuus]|nr:putative RNA-directed DNA polymerase [Helianthus annuus]